LSIFSIKKLKVVRVFVGLVLFIIFRLPATAQDNQEIANQLIQVADEIYSNTQAYNQARDAYVQVLDFDPDNLKANYMAGYLFLQTIQKERATPYLLNVYSIDPEFTFDLMYLIGRGYQFGLDFDNAIDFYNRYIELYNSEPSYDGADKISLELANQRIAECERGKEMVSSPLNYNITNVGPTINSEWPDYGPSVNRDESVMVFTSRRQEGNINSNVFEDNFPYEDIFISYKENDQWTRAQNISPRINTLYFESNLAISDDGKELYIYVDENGGDVYVSTKLNSGQWTRPEPIGGSINTANKETSVSLSPDGKVIFFASDRTGSMGGLDIYYSIRDRRGYWTEIHNIGPPINTPLNDDFPFIDYDGKTLYFSSEGHNGMGGYDIYKTVYDSTDGKWITPVNIGYPINTPDNDISFITTMEGKKGYFSSVKEDGFGYQDIYMFTIPEEIRKITEEEPEIVKEEPVEKKSIRLMLHVTDESGNPIDANVQVRNNDQSFLAGINKTVTGEYVAVLKNENPVSVTISAERDGYMFHNESVTIPGMTEEEQVREFNLRLRKLETGTSMVLRNVYFDFDKATLKQASMVEINKLFQMLSENSRLVVEIAGHTDNIGIKEYNYDLSSRRAKAVVDALKTKGIDPSRLKAVGYGEDRPIASNDDERDGRELNRRVEFRVLSIRN
jgi:outer membrane protein OmpA-like peptidoglycan-associated protein